MNVWLISFLYIQFLNLIIYCKLYICINISNSLKIAFITELYFYKKGFTHILIRKNLKNNILKNNI